MPLHRSLIFWAGILIVSFLFWLRWDAGRNETTLGLRDFPSFSIMSHPEGFSFFGGALFHVGPATFMVVNSWDVFGFLDQGPIILIRNPVPKGGMNWTPDDRVGFTIGHDLLLMIASFFLASALLIRRYRLRSRSIPVAS